MLQVIGKENHEDHIEKNLMEHAHHPRRAPGRISGLEHDRTSHKDDHCSGERKVSEKVRLSDRDCYYDSDEVNHLRAHEGFYQRCSGWKTAQEERSSGMS